MHVSGPVQQPVAQQSQCSCGAQFTISEYRDNLYLDILRRKKEMRRKSSRTTTISRSMGRTRNGDASGTPERRAR